MPWSKKACVDGSVKGRTVLSFSDSDVEQDDLAQSLSLVKDVIGAVDSKVASYEKKVRLHEIYTKTDSKSIMRMKSGQMFAKEDLKRKKLVRDGSVLLKTAAGRLKGKAPLAGSPSGARRDMAEAHPLQTAHPCPYITQDSRHLMVLHLLS